MGSWSVLSFRRWYIFIETVFTVYKRFLVNYLWNSNLKYIQRRTYTILLKYLFVMCSEGISWHVIRFCMWLLWSVFFTASITIFITFYRTAYMTSIIRWILWVMFVFLSWLFPFHCQLIDLPASEFLPKP